jgi:hypothetical protein
MRGQPSTTAVDLITLMLIGAISAAVMVAGSGGLQWLAGAVALATPLLAQRVLRHAAPRPAPAVVVRIERHGHPRRRVA